ncbi:hypothetical protein BVRB_2g038780 isoform B [Beta vulgaris subsp. vulgaris]|nr:hypothetical protein BVRB_2g038780 isoform B [Beta vulgaris subsp. vulgaris]
MRILIAIEENTRCSFRVPCDTTKSLSVLVANWCISYSPDQREIATSLLLL